MSKGNINYKYLRRRKNWFQRNWKALIIYIVLILAVLGAGAFAVSYTHLDVYKRQSINQRFSHNRIVPQASQFWIYRRTE